MACDAKRSPPCRAYPATNRLAVALLGDQTGFTGPPRSGVYQGGVDLGAETGRLISVAWATGKAAQVLVEVGRDHYPEVVAACTVGTLDRIDRLRPL